MLLPRSVNPRVALAALLAFVAATALSASPLLAQATADSPASPPPLPRFERIGSGHWHPQGDEVRFAGRDQSFAVAAQEDWEQGAISAELTPRRGMRGGFVFAGLAMVADVENFWRLLLVSGPDNRLYFELSEQLAGTHQAQSAPGTALPGRREGSLATWQYGQPYRMRLEWNPRQVIGEVRTKDEKVFVRFTYDLSIPRAVRLGRPGLFAHGFEGVFRQVRLEGQAPTLANPLKLVDGTRGRIALVPDDPPRQALRLKPLLEAQGFGVTTVSWDQLARVRPRSQDLDLLLLADARRLPASVMPWISGLLRTQGKLLAVGTPAFTEMLYPTPHGYAPADAYTQWLYQTVEKTPLRLSPARWRRTARNAGRDASIAQKKEPDAAGSEVWQVDVDLDGWDNFGQAVEGQFSAQRPVLALEAKGDAATTQLAIECVERDGSRWIATLPLRTRWQTYLVRPADFAFWKDSPAKRGRPGDRFQPSAASSLRIGLSSSHTPECKPGRHTYWFRHLASASEPTAEPLEHAPPDIEALCPSYKLYPLPQLARYRSSHPVAALKDIAATDGISACAPVPRESGAGIDRQRPWRFLPLVEGLDAQGQARGALAALMLGGQRFPGAIWGSVGCVDPALDQVVARTAAAMVRGVFLREAGTRSFSYLPGESIEVGARVFNARRNPCAIRLLATIRDAAQKPLWHETAEVNLRAGDEQMVRWHWQPKADQSWPCLVTIEAMLAGEVVDTLSHPIDRLPTEPVGPEEFVRVHGSQFLLQGKPWVMRGVNYRPNAQGGRETISMFDRGLYDPEVIERDLAWLSSQGINLLSGIQAPQPENPDDPAEYRDLRDFLNRCHRRGIKVFYFLHGANPLAGGSAENVIRHISAAGLRDHPAILAWELSWEPIYYAGTRNRAMDFLLADWNRWIIERYGSLANAEADWQHRLPASSTATSKKTSGGQPADQAAPLPPFEWLMAHGPWDRVVATFRRFFSDHLGEAYGRLIRRLRRYDQNHLITFRFGACGIPNQARFAHAHSIGVAKLVDFLCPEGYDLQRQGPAKPANPDDIRTGGLTTLYYRFISREKPVVWMEFGYSVNGMHNPWQSGRERIPLAELAQQATEYEQFLQMIVESGSRGAAPWWYPGGFRLGERSDFGLVEPDGTPRPAWKTLVRHYQKMGVQPDQSCIWSQKTAESTRPVIDLNFDAHYADALQTYGPKYLEAISRGNLPYLRTPGTGTDSANCPLLALGGTTCNGRNPPQFLNAQFESLEIQEGERSPWADVPPGGPVVVKQAAKVRLRARLENLGEAQWLAPRGKDDKALGRVWLNCRLGPSGTQLQLPIAADTPYLDDGQVLPFDLPLGDVPRQRATLQLQVRRSTSSGQELTIPFGGTSTLELHLIP